MNYYKQGDAANADKIKAAFEKLGYDTTGWKFNVEYRLYYTHDGRIDFECDNFPINLIKTHPDYKELELPIEPKFKVGDKIQEKHTKMYVYTVLSVDLQNQRYLVEHNYKHQLLFTSQDNFELAPKLHYDIANFHAGMPVLVRDYNNSQWSYVQFSHLIAERNVGEGGFKFNACGIPYSQCIPFNDDTKHLLGTTDPCDEQYINW